MGAPCPLASEFSVTPCFPDWSHVFGSESLQALESAISPKSENGIFLLENGIWKARSRAPGSGSWPWHQLYLAGGSVTIPAPAQARRLPEAHGAVQGAEQERLLCRERENATGGAQSFSFHIPAANNGRKIDHWGEVHAEVLEFNEWYPSLQIHPLKRTRDAL